MTKIAAFGEPLIGFYHVKEKNGSSAYFKMTIGGDTSNVVLQLAKLGYSVEYISKLGKDYFGEEILRVWDKWGVKHRYVKIDPDHQTGVYFTIFNDEGKHKFIYKRENSAAANYSIEDAEKVNLKEIEVFHFSGISQAISKNALEASFYFAKKCKSMGIWVSYDLNYRAPLWSEDYFSSVASYTVKKYADIVTLNLEEAAAFKITSNVPKEIIREILSYGPKIVALKLGGQGCLIGDKSGKILFRKSKKVEVADTVGAGDAFDAGVIDGVLRGMELKEIADYANLIASLVCKKVGSTEGQPTKADLGKFLKEVVRKTNRSKSKKFTSYNN